MNAILTYRGSIAVITLNRPEAMNALNGAMIERLAGLFDEVHRSEADALIIVGAGDKAFCAGADVNEILGKGVEEQKVFAQRGQQTFAKLDALSIPSIAVVSGVAFGGGLELAMACTYRIATPNARLALPEIKLGLLPGYGGTQRLPRIVGAARALEIISTGRVVGSQEAERIGLINRIDEGADSVTLGLQFVSALGSPPPASLRMVRQAVLQAQEMPLEEGFKLESKLFAAATQTADAKEGVHAFLEKRKPQFIGE